MINNFLLSHIYFFIITGLTIGTIILPPIVNTKIRFLTPIIFAAIPTQASKLAFNVSTKSLITFISALVASSDFCHKNTTSLTMGFIIFAPTFLNPNINTIILFY